MALTEASFAEQHRVLSASQAAVTADETRPNLCGALPAPQAGRTVWTIVMFFRSSISLPRAFPTILIRGLVQQSW